ncbi:hypothetical protein F2Q69_00049233 [Brassica cretica]|uniref:Uncharacterized protein n=1 Tax=Brassica cretica TaxID=69181 RepID=A0A8S9Q2G4_BRACR|nr:hypothetical protein F2Q69_00049233 [Brassica cretica]
MTTKMIIVEYKCLEDLSDAKCSSPSKATPKISEPKDLSSSAAPHHDSHPHSTTPCLL